MITLEDIRAARKRIGNAIYLSPCAHSETLSCLCGCEVFLKLENLQMTGSSKERGALNKIMRLTDKQRAAGIIAASAGNHAQGVAHGAKLSGIKATIVMPETTPLAKIRGTRELGAEVVLYGANYEEAYDKARELRATHDYTLIHAFDDPEVIAGQDTIGLELLEQLPQMDVVVVPVGGGGLIAGIATAIKAVQPKVRVIGVESDRLPAMRESLTARRVKPLHPASTIADGIAVAVVGNHTLPIVSRYVSEIVTVIEEEIARAIMILLEREKTLAEGGGAVGLAALYHRKIRDVNGKNIVVVISGGNIDMNILSRIIERGLEADGRLAQLKVTVPDKPDSIAKLATLLANQFANIFNIAQNRSAKEVQLGEMEVVLTLETKGHQHVAEIIGSILAMGYSVK